MLPGRPGWLAWLAWFGGLLLLSACEGPPPAGSAEIQLGTVDLRRYGDSRWVDITDAQDVELAPGAQGGFHIWLRYRVRGLSGMVIVKRTADRLDGDGSRKRVLTADGAQVIPAQQGQAFWELPDPIPNFMCPTPVGISVVDQLIEITVRLEEEAGTPLTEGRARVTARCPPDGPRDFCLRICSG